MIAARDTDSSLPGTGVPRFPRLPYPRFMFVSPLLTSRRVVDLCRVGSYLCSPPLTFAGTFAQLTSSLR